MDFARYYMEMLEVAELKSECSAKGSRFLGILSKPEISGSIGGMTLDYDTSKLFCLETDAGKLLEGEQVTIEGVKYTMSKILMDGTGGANIYVRPYQDHSGCSPNPDGECWK